MTALQVRDFPQDLYDQLKVRSEAEHRSMSQQVIVAVEQMLGLDALQKKLDPAVFKTVHSSFDADGRVQERIESRKRIFDRLADLKIDIPDDLPDPTVLLRKEREARTEHFALRPLNMN